MRLSVSRGTSSCVERLKLTCGMNGVARSWTDSLPPEWPHAHSKAQAARYKELLSRVKELSLERAKLSEQRYVYQVRFSPSSLSHFGAPLG